MNDIETTAVMNPADVTGVHRGMKDRPIDGAGVQTYTALIPEAGSEGYHESRKSYPPIDKPEASSPYFNASVMPSVEQEPSFRIDIPEPPRPDLRVLLAAQARFIGEQSFFLRTPTADPMIYTQGLQRYSEEQDRMIAILTNALRQAGVL